MRKILLKAKIGAALKIDTRYSISFQISDTEPVLVFVPTVSKII